MYECKQVLTSIESSWGRKCSGEETRSRQTTEQECIPVGCIPSGGGVSQHALGRGVYPSMHWALSQHGLGRGGVWPGGVYSGGVCPGGLPRGVSGQGVSVSKHALHRGCVYPSMY